MHLAAVRDASDDDLFKLGLRAKGDILALRGYCSRMNVINKVSDSSSRNKLLIECIKSNGRIGEKAEKDKYRLCYSGFMMYDRKNRRYSQLRATNGGGTREMKFKMTATQKEIIDFAKSKFFVYGRNSKHGQISSFSSFQLGNSSGEPIPSKLIVDGEEVDFT